jgi:hypothetical protein
MDRNRPSRTFHARFAALFPKVSSVHVARRSGGLKVLFVDFGPVARSGVAWHRGQDQRSFDWHRMQPLMETAGRPGDRGAGLTAFGQLSLLYSTLEREEYQISGFLSSSIESRSRFHASCGDGYHAKARRREGAKGEEMKLGRSRRWSCPLGRLAMAQDRGAIAQFGRVLGPRRPALSAGSLKAIQNSCHRKFCLHWKLRKSIGNSGADSTRIFPGSFRP